MSTKMFIGGIPIGNVVNFQMMKSAKTVFIPERRNYRLEVPIAVQFYLYGTQHRLWTSNGWVANPAYLSKIADMGLKLDVNNYVELPVGLIITRYGSLLYDCMNFRTYKKHNDKFPIVGRFKLKFSEVNGIVLSEA
jgi:hypothetical protein